VRLGTRELVYSLTISEVEAALNLSARAVAALVERGVLGALLLRRGMAGLRLDDARFRTDHVERLRTAEGELAPVRAVYPRRTREYDRAIALGALLEALPH
jgi:hypothetical protein